MAKESTKEDITKGMSDRVALFDKEFQALQVKYSLRLVAQYFTPVNPNEPNGPMCVTNVPIQAFPTGDYKPKEVASKPE